MDDELLSGNFGQHQNKSGDQHVNTPSFTDLDEETRPQGNDENSFRDSLPSGSPQKYNPGTNRTNESPERSQSPPPKVKHVVSEKKPYTSPTKAARLAKQKQYEEECANLTLEERALRALNRAHKIVGTPHHLHAQDISKGANVFLQGEIRTQEVLTKAEAILEKSHKVGLTDDELDKEEEEQKHKLSENVYPTKSPIKTEKLVDSTLKQSASYTKRERDGSSSPFKGRKGDDKLPSFGGSSTPTKGGMKASQDLKKSQELVRRLKETYGSASKNDEAIQKAGEILKKPPQSPLLARSGTKMLESGGGNKAVLERSNTKVRNFYEEVSPGRFGESPNRQSKVQDAFNEALGQSQVMIKRSGTMLGGGGNDGQSPFKSMKTSYSQIFEGWGRAKSVFLENTSTFVIDPEKKDAINVKESYQSNLYLFGASLYACSPPGFFIPKDEQKPIFVDERNDDGSTYKGEKLKDFRHGRGKLTYVDGSSYDGEWDHGRKNGYGVFTMLTGRVLYDGEWRNDQYHGRGILYNNTNQDVDGFDCKDFDTLENNWWKYEGEFENGKKNGLGSLVLRTTEKFTGIFKLDKVHGIGTFHPKSGKIVSGTWDYNKLVSEV